MAPFKFLLLIIFGIIGARSQQCDLIGSLQCMASFSSIPKFQISVYTDEFKGSPKTFVQEMCLKLKELYDCVGDKLLGCAPQYRLIYETAVSSGRFVCGIGKQGFINHFRCLTTHTMKNNSFRCGGRIITVIREIFSNPTSVLTDLVSRADELCINSNDTLKCVVQSTSGQCGASAASYVQQYMDASVSPLRSFFSCVGEVEEPYRNSLSSEKKATDTEIPKTQDQIQGSTFSRKSTPRSKGPPTPQHEQNHVSDKDVPNTEPTKNTEYPPIPKAEQILGSETRLIKSKLIQNAVTDQISVSEPDSLKPKPEPNQAQFSRTKSNRDNVSIIRKPVSKAPKNTKERFEVNIDKIQQREIKTISDLKKPEPVNTIAHPKEKFINKPEPKNPVAYPKGDLLNRPKLKSLNSFAYPEEESINKSEPERVNPVIYPVEEPVIKSKSDPVNPVMHEKEPFNKLQLEPVKSVTLTEEQVNDPETEPVFPDMNGILVQPEEEPMNELETALPAQEPTTEPEPALPDKEQASDPEPALPEQEPTTELEPALPEQEPTTEPEPALPEQNPTSEPEIVITKTVNQEPIQKVVLQQDVKPTNQNSFESPKLVPDRTSPLKADKGLFEHEKRNLPLFNSVKIKEPKNVLQKKPEHKEIQSEPVTPSFFIKTQRNLLSPDSLRQTTPSPNDSISKKSQKEQSTISESVPRIIRVRVPIRFQRLSSTTTSTTIAPVVSAKVSQTCKKFCFRFRDSSRFTILQKQRYDLLCDRTCRAGSCQTSICTMNCGCPRKLVCTYTGQRRRWAGDGWCNNLCRQRSPLCRQTQCRCQYA